MIKTNIKTFKIHHQKDIISEYENPTRNCKLTGLTSEIVKIT